MELPIIAEYDNTNIICFQIEGHTLNTTAEFHHLSGLDFGQSEHSSNTITNRYDSSEFFQIVL